MTRKIALIAAWMFASAAVFTQESQSFRLPPYTKFVLKNGLSLYLMEQHEVPMITVSVLCGAGAVHDESRYGLAGLTADALLFGTEKYSKNQIEETLELLGVNYQTSAQLEFSRIYMSFLNKDIETVLPILNEILSRPQFDAEEFEKHKTRLLLELEQDKEQPSGVIPRYFNRFLYGDHEYGNPVSGIPSTVSQLTVEDIRRFYSMHYGPKVTTVAVVGDFKTAEMKKRMTRLLQDWEHDVTVRTIDPPRPAVQKNRVLLVNKEDATETQFIIGGNGIKRSNPDFVAIQVVNTVLGGRFTSWLNDELRINRGLTYGAGSRFITNKHAGSFIVSSYTRTPKTEEALDVALEVLNRLHGGIDSETLGSARNYIQGQYPPQYETARSLASLLNSMYFYGYDESFINQFQKNVQGMTEEKAREIVTRYFPMSDLTIVMIGKASEIREVAQKYGELTEKEIKAEGY